MAAKKQSATSTPTLKRKPKLDFRPSKVGGIFLRFDTVTGRVKVIGASDEDLLTRGDELTMHVDLDNAKTGWLDFHATGDSAVVSDNRDEVDLGLDWGIELPIAMPYPATIEGVTLNAIPRHNVRSTTSLLLESLSELNDEVETAERGENDRVAVVRVERWEVVQARGTKRYFKPHFELLGFAPELEKPKPLAVAA